MYYNPIEISVTCSSDQMGFYQHSSGVTCLSTQMVSTNTLLVSHVYQIRWVSTSTLLVSHVYQIRWVSTNTLLVSRVYQIRWVSTNTLLPTKAANNQEYDCQNNDVFFLTVSNAWIAYQNISIRLDNHCAISYYNYIVYYSILVFGHCVNRDISHSIKCTTYRYMWFPIATYCQVNVPMLCPTYFVLCRFCSLANKCDSFWHLV